MLIMKKLTAIFLCFAMALSLAACGNTTSSTNESSTPESSVPPASSEASDTSSTAASQEPASQEETKVEAGNTLVVYFSATGNTEQAATYIADITGGDLFELEPADPYTDEDLNYNHVNDSGNGAADGRAGKFAGPVRGGLRNIRRNVGRGFEPQVSD